jgi:hypothetical protein
MFTAPSALVDAVKTRGLAIGILLAIMWDQIHVVTKHFVHATFQDWLRSQLKSLIYVFRISPRIIECREGQTAVGHKGGVSPMLETAAAQIATHDGAWLIKHTLLR